MLTYSLNRLLQLVITTLGVVTLVFFTLRLIPGDAASAMAGDTLSGEALERLREQMGLNKPIIIQYLDYLRSLLFLNFGETITTGLPISGLLMTAIPITLTIAVSTIVLTIIIAIPLGTLAAFMAHKGHKTLDNLITGTAMLVDLMPSFWTALVFLLFFSLTLGWFPASGTVSFEEPRAFIMRIALPVLVLSVTQVATMARITRTAVLACAQERRAADRHGGWPQLRQPAQRHDHRRVHLHDPGAGKPARERHQQPRLRARADADRFLCAVLRVGEFPDRPRLQEARSSRSVLKLPRHMQGINRWR
jgi:peptide/nickel transport system permease protein